MTQSERLYEIARQSLKSLVTELERENRFASALLALAALCELDKIENPVMPEKLVSEYVKKNGGADLCDDEWLKRFAKTFGVSMTLASV